MPVTLLVDTGTSGPAEVFAAALAGNKRAELIGERTIGRTGVQELVKLPDGSALWITSTRYLTPAGAQLQAKGLEPDVVVDQPEGEFGAPRAGRCDSAARDRKAQHQEGRVGEPSTI